MRKSGLLIVSDALGTDTRQNMMLTADETSRQFIVRIRTYMWAIGVLWTVAVGGSLAWNVMRLEGSAMDLVRAQARESHAKDLLYRRWNAARGGVYVPISEETPPNPYLDVENRDIETTTGLKMTLVNPAYMTRQAHELQKEAGGVYGHITSLDPIRPQNAPDGWEASALWQFEKGAEEVSSVEKLDGREYMRLMRPLLVEPACMKCHAKQGYEVGEVRGGISVSVPMRETRQTIHWGAMVLAASHGFLWLLGGLGVGIAGRTVTRRVSERERALQDLSRANTLLADEVQERKRLQGELMRVQAAVDSASDAVVIMDQQSQVIYTNGAFGARFGSLRLEDLGAVRCLFYDPSCADASFWNAMAGESRNTEVEMRERTGVRFPALLRATGIIGVDGDVEGVLFIFTDITQRKLLEEHLRTLASQDGLTQVANRRTFEEMLAQEWARGTRNGSSLAVIMIDIDDFKRYNDLYGHVVGDGCLRRVAAEIARAAQRPTDIVCRFGGEEFAILLPDTDIKGAQGVAARACLAVSALNIEHAESRATDHVTVSIGVASCVPLPAVEAVALVHAADEALYSAKASGRNRVCLGGSASDAVEPAP